MDRKIRAVLVAMLALSLFSCGGKNAEAAKARAAFLAEAKGRLDSTRGKLDAAGDDEGKRLESLREMLRIEVMELGDTKGALEVFGANEALLAGDVQSRIFVAVGQSMQAGREKKIENKLVWLRKGMRSFEKLDEDYPTDEMVHLYQASTYANFPQEVGAKLETLDILDAMRASYLAGAWKLEDGVARQLAYVYGALAKNNPDAESAKEIGASRDAMAKALPPFARALAVEGNEP